MKSIFAILISVLAQAQTPDANVRNSELRLQGIVSSMMRLPTLENAALVAQCSKFVNPTTNLNPAKLEDVAVIVGKFKFQIEKTIEREAILNPNTHKEYTADEYYNFMMSQALKACLVTLIALEFDPARSSDEILNGFTSRALALILSARANSRRWLQMDSTAEQMFAEQVESIVKTQSEEDSTKQAPKANSDTAKKSRGPR